MPTIDETLTPAHLTPIADLKKQASERIEQQALTPEDEQRLAMKQREYTFRFRYPADEKQPAQYEGTFTSKILSVRDRQQVGVMRAQLNGGIPLSSLDGLTNQINATLAHLAYQLDDTKKDFPEWAKDLRSLYDANVIFALYEEVERHERTFLGRV